MIIVHVHQQHIHRHMMRAQINRLPSMVPLQSPQGFFPVAARFVCDVGRRTRSQVVGKQLTHSGCMVAVCALLLVLKGCLSLNLSLSYPTSPGVNKR